LWEVRAVDRRSRRPQITSIKSVLITMPGEGKSYDEAREVGGKEKQRGRGNHIVKSWGGKLRTVEQGRALAIGRDSTKRIGRRAERNVVIILCSSSVRPKKKRRFGTHGMI